MDVAYHCAPRTARSRITREGLRPSATGKLGVPDAVGAAIYLWPRYGAAVQWADLTRGGDIWAVDVRGCALEADPHMGAGAMEAFVARDPLGPERVRLCSGARLHPLREPEWDPFPETPAGA